MQKIGWIRMKNHRHQWKESLCVMLILLCICAPLAAFADGSGLDALPWLTPLGETLYTLSDDLPVYTGPSASYYRTGGGTAEINHKTWVTVYGRQNGFLLIQYDALRFEGCTHFAYADADMFLDTFPKLQLAAVPILVSQDAVPADEPLTDRVFPNMTINFEHAVALARIMDADGKVWVYFEATCVDVSDDKVKQVRGFVDAEDVTFP